MKQIPLSIHVAEQSRAAARKREADHDAALQRTTCGGCAGTEGGYDDEQSANEG